MNIIVPIALFGWIPAVLLLFCIFPPRRAVLAAFLFAWLFLPIASYKIAPGIPLYSKMSATCVGVLLGAFLFDLQRPLSFRPQWLDVPMAVWCMCPLFSSIQNGLGLYDGLSAVIYQTITWGSPYFIGRVYFATRQSIRELAIGIFIGGLIYVPLCLFEIRMSPQLHTWIYGYHQHSIVQEFRFGGYRPTVFMDHGLMVGMWMAMASLIGVWLWWGRSVPRMVRQIPIAWILVGLLATTVLCKSTGSLALLGVGLAALFTATSIGTRALVWILIAAAPVYISVRAPAIWDGAALVSMARDLVDDSRAESLAFRQRNEDILAAKAMQRPIFGWGGWGRNRVFDESGQDVSITDGWWIIEFGSHGAVGLLSGLAVFLLPAGLVFAQYPVARWRQPGVAPMVAAAMVIVLYMLDCITNAMINPIFMLIAGGLAGVRIPEAPRHRTATAMLRAEQVAADGLSRRSVAEVSPVSPS